MEKPTHMNRLTDTRGQSWIPMRLKTQHSGLGGSSRFKSVYQMNQASILLVIGRLPCLFVGGFKHLTESCNLQQELKETVSIRLLSQGLHHCCCH